MNRRSTWLIALVLLSLGFAAQDAGRKWWMDEPIRLVQTNLRETDAALDPQRHVQQVAEFGANALLFNVGGIVAFYPTQIAYHYPSAHLAAGRDLFGDVVREAHRRHIRVIGRFDLSKTQKPVFDAHPEWFFKSVKGQPAIYSGLYSTCINGGYYRDHALKILTEALERYEVDGLFFNMFGNPSHDYSGNPLGPCQCDACRSRFHKLHGRALPTEPDETYRRFMAESALEVAQTLAELIHRKRPGAAFLTYIQSHTDGIMSESNTAVNRPLPLWLYSASDNVDRARNSEPGKMAFNLCMSFIDYPWRFAPVPTAEIRLRLYQNMAHGAGPAFTVLGTFDQEDMSAIRAARPIFKWHSEHEDLYVHQENAARVLLVGGRQAPYRGFFRLLSEQHIPFAVSDNLKWLDDRSRRFDLVIVPDGPSSALEAFVREGGRLLVAGTTPPPFGVKTEAGLHSKIQGYWRIRDHSLFPSLAHTRLLFFEGEYAKLDEQPIPALTLIPPATFGPPEKVWTDKQETNIPGLSITKHGTGEIVYVPWDVGSLYYRHSSQAHAGFMADLVDHLLSRGRQLRTDAHPLVEITLMKQPDKPRTLVHFVNLSGHSGTAYFDPVPFRSLKVEVKGDFSRARAVSARKSLDLTRDGDYASFVLPQLDGYEVVVLE
ncbi:MAG: hypothetical protein EHM23_33180 [Acidobacteria bacterium]|nr:MAG: hypothetical protein EHM23_33180 [Acidobacteriota bacterium]